MQKKERGITSVSYTHLVGKYIQEMLLGQKSAKQVLESIDNDRQKMFAATGQ